jgi:beta-galactosidase
MAGSESSFYDDSGFALVTVPHAVTPLSWRYWNASAWQQMWIYRRHFTGGPLISSRRPGNRIMVEFDGVMVNATVVINDQAVATHQGGYLPSRARGRATAPRSTTCSRSWWTATSCRCRR